MLIPLQVTGGLEALQRPSFRWVGVLVFAVALTGCGGAKNNSGGGAKLPQISKTDDFSPGHQRMLEMLADIRDRAPDEHQYFGRKLHVQLREQLANYDAETRPLERFSALSYVGHLELGFEETPHRAISTLLEAQQLLETLDIAPEMKRIGENKNYFFLGVCYLRLGETENCCLRHTAESCILPIRGAGIHKEEEGSRKAIEYFQMFLDATRGEKEHGPFYEWHATARWLLNIAYMTLNEYPAGVPVEYQIPAKFFESEVEFPEFKNVMPELGLEVNNAAGGVVVDDFDNDDYLDILVATSDPTGQTKYFRNNRDGTFSDLTESAGLSGMYGGLNMVQGDYDNDGDLDVFVLRGAWHEELGRHPNSLWRNNGNGTFSDVTFDAGLGETHYPTKTGAWSDYDNDGDLDLYVANETSPNIRAPSQLFQNQGDGTFIDVAKESGTQVSVFAMGAVWGDYDDDRLPDLFIASNPRNILFHNKGDGTFEDVAGQAGVVRPRSPFPVWFWDFDNDRVLDLFISSTSGPVGVLSLNSVSSDPSPDEGFVKLNESWKPPNISDLVLSDDPQVRYDKLKIGGYELPALYRGNGQGGFDEIASAQNLDYPSKPMGANFGDLNGDGFLDFYLATGDVNYWELRPNVMFLNRGGTGFDNVTMGGGFGHLQKGHGVSFADIDNDGDQDIYVQMGGQLPGDKFNDALFENPGFGHHWINIKLVGTTSNKSAIGARIDVTIIEDGGTRQLHRRVNSGGSFGCNPLRQNIGLGRAEKIESLVISWPTSNMRQEFGSVPLDRVIEIVEGEDQYRQIQIPAQILGGND